MLMTQTMRWFGPDDPVGLAAIRQTGATEVVTALHEIPNGAVWTVGAIAARAAVIADAGLGWTVVESLPVHEGIKTRSADCDALVASYGASLRNLAACGITVVTYNFMPLLDWTRTDLAWRMPDGARALRFEWLALAVYDIHILRRANAAPDYPPALVAAAAARHAAMDDAGRALLERTIIAGLPGSEERFTSAKLAKAIDGYDAIDAATLRDHLVAFLEAVCPIADAVGIRLVLHPDDPPFPIFGLPRVASTEADFTALFARVPAASNGLCFCTGSLGARDDNDLPGIVDRLGERIGFLHLRSVQRENERTFHEAAHLEGDARMAAVVRAVHNLSVREQRSIPMRPDHGHQMLDDLSRVGNPGYALIGRMRGLAELRGLERGIAYAAGLTACAAFLLSLALPAVVHSQAADSRVAERVSRLTRATVWTPVAEIKLKFRTFHPQGMVRIGRDFYISSVEVTRLPARVEDPKDRHDRTPGAGVGHLFKVAPDGTLLADLVLGEGTMYHPGGIDFDGTSIWVPVSEYRPASRAIIYRVDPATMRANETFRFADHIGAIVHDLADDTLRGADWGSRRLYTWPLQHTGRPANASASSVSVNAEQYIDYQDCHYVGDDRMLCSGVGEYRAAPTAPIFQLGGLDLIDLRTNNPVWQVPVELRAPSGWIMTQNPYFATATETGLRVHFMPDDEHSTIYVFDATQP